ncbi:MAG: hypothetical protein HC836_32795 [Richelia sp. RM2_1_2]|nr:hypothetical protein [Richelia sp. RM2_1_2]
MKKFQKNTKGFKVLTDNGYRDFSGVACMGFKQVWRIELSNGFYLEATDTHKLIDGNGEILAIANANINDKVQSLTGTAHIISITKKGIEPVYDLIDVDSGHKYFTNGVLSHNCEFLSAEETLVSSMVLQNLKSKEPSRVDGLIRWYERPLPNRVYLLGLDPSTGTGGDRAAIQVFMLPEMRQIAEWCDNTSPPKLQVEVIHKMLNYIKSELSADLTQKQNPDESIYWTFENNGVGEAISSLVVEIGEEKFPGHFTHEPKRAGLRKGRRGLTTSFKPKIAACTKLKSLVESGRIELVSSPLVAELKNYIRSGQSFEAKSGSTDDLVSATLLIIRLAEIVRDFDPHMTEKLREVILLEGEEAEPLPFIMSVSF